MRQAVIVAGGSGTRLVCNGVLTPKLLLPLDGKRLIDFLIVELELEGFTHALFILGVGSSEIISYLSTLESKIVITYTIEKEKKGTFGALVQSLPLLSEKFIVIYGDLFLSNANLGGIFSHFLESGMNAAVLCKFTDHPLDSDLIELDEKFVIKNIFSYPHQDVNSIPPIAMAGVFYFSKSVITDYFQIDFKDISREFLPKILGELNVRAYFHQGTIRDLGTTQRLSEAHNLVRNLQKPLTYGYGVLLDRDGVINEDYGYVVDIDNVTLTNFAALLFETIQKNRWGFGVVTNQPAVSRGMITEEGAFSLTQSILSMINTSYMDFGDIYVCPHHPDSGFSGEIKSLKKKCFCRKPAPGLLLACLKSLSLRATNVLIIGDSLTDVQAAQAIGAKALHVHHENHFAACKLQDGVKCTPPESVVRSLEAWGKNDSF